MIRPVLIASLVSTFWLSPEARPQESSRQVIKIRMLNGKTGKPVANELVNVWLGDQGRDSILKTDLKGEIRVPVENIQPRKLWFLPSVSRDCRFKTVSRANMGTSYSLDQIISAGIVTDNFCGKQQAARVPGVFVVFVRKPSFFESIWE